MRLFPSAPIVDILLTWVTAARVTYNNALYHESTTRTTSSEYALRTLFVNENTCQREDVSGRAVVHGGVTASGERVCSAVSGFLKGRDKPNGKILSKERNPNVSEWMAGVPKQVRFSGVADYVGARSACFSNLKAGNIRSFRMRYRKRGEKKYPSVNVGSGIGFDGKYVSFFPRKLSGARARPGKRKGKGRVMGGRILVGKSDREFLGSVASGEGGFSECRLKYANGKWVLLVPYTPAAVQAEGTDPQGVAALDRGARVFTTVYDGDRVVAVEHDRKLMAKLQARLDKLRSLRARKAISSRSYLRGRRRTKRRWDNLMRDLHYKLASELVKYKAVGLPSFETENMVQGGLARSTKRELLGLQHGKFKQRLIHKARGRTHVLPTDERCVVVQIPFPNVCLCGPGTVFEWAFRELTHNTRPQTQFLDQDVHSVRHYP